MSSTNLSRFAIIPILLAMVSCMPAGASVDQQSHTAAVLLSEYETVFFTNTDLSSHFSSFKKLSRQSAATLTVPFGYLIGALDSANPHAAEEIMSRTDFVMMGAKNFIMPEGEGGAQLTDFCYVATFGTRGAPDLHKYFTSAPVATVNGAPGWKWFGQIYGDGIHGVYIYAAQIGPTQIAFTSSVGALQGLATKLNSGGDADAALNTIPEWQSVSQREYWGYRRVRRDGEMQPDAAHLETTMTGTDTVIMFADIKAKTATVRVLGANSQEYLERTGRQEEQQRAAMARIGMRSSPDNFVPFHATGPRSLEKEFSLASPQAEGEVLTADGLMGFELII